MSKIKITEEQRIWLEREPFAQIEILKSVMSSYPDDHIERVKIQNQIDRIKLGNKR